MTWSIFLIVYRAVTYKNYLPLNRLIHVPSDSNILSEEQLTSAFKEFLEKTYPGSLIIKDYSNTTATLVTAGLEHCSTKALQD